MTDWAQEFAQLNIEQQEAVRHPGNTVVLAGPGSGKTKTLVIKVAHLLEEDIAPPRGLACITYNNDTVREFRARLRELGIHASRRLYLGTVHSFCLNCILRPYAGLIYPEFRHGVVVASPRQSEAMLGKALLEHMPRTAPGWYGATLTRFRRMIACGEDTSGFGDSDPLVCETYERMLAERNLVDFESMVILSLKILTEHDWVPNLLESRYPWLIVDEYQDLGGPLHKIVLLLMNTAKIKVLAVGDPDQTIYDFTGADPKYLNELATRQDFRTIHLRFNYRSGQRLIDAGQAALAPERIRHYEAAPDRDHRGEVFFAKADDYLEDHACKTADIVRHVIGDGTLAEEVAIFYQRRTVLLQDIRNELEQRGIPHVAERDFRYTVSPIIRWLQEATAWSRPPPLGQRA